MKTGSTDVRRGDAAVLPARHRLLVVLATLALVAAACGGDGDGGAAGDGDPASQDAATSGTEPVDEGEPVAGGSITVAALAETNSWLPGAASWTAGAPIAYAIYDPLMALTADGTVEPYLAESLEPNDDLTEWTLTLREGVTFHDGTPVDADAIKANFDDYLKVPTSSYAGQLEKVTSFEATGDLTGVYTLEQGNAAFPDLLTFGAGMPFSPTAAAEMGEDYGDNPVGAGPFKFVSWQRDNRLEVERYEDYWQEGMPYLDSITFRPISDEDSRLQSLMTGEVQAMDTWRPNTARQLVQAEEDGTIDLQMRIGNNSLGSIFNTLVPPLDDLRVRQGLVHAIDQEGIIEVSGGGGFIPTTTQWFSEDSPWYSEAVAEAWPQYDPELAQELLDEYVDDPQRSDGKAPGEPIAFEYTCTADASTATRSEAYQAYWSQVGVEVELTQAEYAVWIAAVTGSPETDPPYQGDFESNCFSFGGDADPYTILSARYGPVETNPTNYSNYTSEAMDESLEIMRSSTSFDDRYAAVEAIMLDFAENVPGLYTGGTPIVIATTHDVHGVDGWVLPGGQRGAPGYRWGQAWMEQ